MRAVERGGGQRGRTRWTACATRAAHGASGTQSRLTHPLLLRSRDRAVGSFKGGRGHRGGDCELSLCTSNVEIGNRLGEKKMESLLQKALRDSRNPSDQRRLHTLRGELRKHEQLASQVLLFP